MVLFGTISGLNQGGGSHIKNIYRVKYSRSVIWTFVVISFNVN